MKLIPLTQGLFAKVDDEDYEWLNQWKWLAKESDKGHFYACRNPPREKGKNRTMIRMHNLIMGVLEGNRVDHKDRDGLNNQRNNLRFSTPSQNSANTSVRVNKKSSNYFGVFKMKSYNKTYWKAAIKVNYKQVSLGTYPFTANGEVLAAKAYNEAAVKYKGEFAHINIIPQLPISESEL